ncbi:arabinogalactan oligomer/maltooligosaccharide transport system permease protein [Nocardiopsis mwathae]|uniref:Arabinogalactan oligomer/maltooligosaccharide transport system permease protein n=1 Tax=Nocardiopsis mwathae TaxID=1472723 RepID=A0A7W9YGD5_9ACTN|nr:carbohydrate ABC transporter permease [Nocardiopsis mwathae]MBB6171599.1 arabinogalactan oligomer/maltooligosaccharide transport system permease protein [Nocardiopsis mwathae]
MVSAEHTTTPAVRGRRRRAGPRTRPRAASLALHGVLLCASGAAVLPVVWIVLTSLKPRGAWQSTRIELFHDPSPANYVQVLGSTSFLTWFANSLVVAGGTTALALLLAATTGYALSRFRFPGMRPLLWTLLVTQMFPVAILIVPLYNVLSGLGLINTHLGLTLTYLTIAVPFSAWMLRGTFDTIPVEIDEAGRVDGLSPLGTFWRLVLPLARPGLAVVAFYAFITAWGEVAYATAFLTTDATATLAVGLGQFVGQQKAEWGMLSAASVLIAAPATVVFLLVQRHLVAGLAAGSGKS